jgi:F0F1-type ATP synthase assembly protein I
VFAVFRPLAAFINGIIGGVMVLILKDESVETKPVQNVPDLLCK